MTSSTDLLALYSEDLGLPTTSTSISTTKASKETGRFLQKHYTLFSTPYFRIYLQGVLPIDGLMLEPVDFAAVFKLAKVIKIGYKGQASPELLALINELLASPKLRALYSDIEWHKDLLVKLAQAGALLDKNKVANKAAVEATINEYCNDLLVFLEAQGFNSPSDYLLAKPNGTSKALDLSSPEAFNSFFDSL